MNKEQVCYNEGDFQEGEIYAWVMDAFVTGHPSSPELTDHLRHSSSCFYQVAEIWSVLSEENVVSENRVPAPSLSFLPSGVSG